MISAAVEEGQQKAPHELTTQDAYDIIAQTVDSQSYYQSVAQLACGRYHCSPIKQMRDEVARATVLIHVNRWAEPYRWVIPDSTLRHPTLHGTINILAQATANLIDNAHGLMFERRFPNDHEEGSLEVAALTVNIERLIFLRELEDAMISILDRREQEAKVLDFWEQVRKAQGG